MSHPNLLHAPVNSIIHPAGPLMVAGPMPAGQPAATLESWGQFLLRPLRYCWEHPALTLTYLMGITAIAAGLQKPHKETTVVAPLSQPGPLSDKDIKYLQNHLPGWQPSDGTTWKLDSQVKDGLTFDWERMQQLVAHRQENEQRHQVRHKHLYKHGPM